MQPNNGNGTSSDISFMSNAAATEIGVGVLFADYDNDGMERPLFLMGIKGT
ncbi:MAG: hypothetical protein IPP25_17240 [Saprospiraceae bacterium]|nr:hypothetical protein [Candidatus Opimibacter skivensis]